MPGESLSYVFLEKLPYPSIGDPVEASRMNAVEAAGGNPFYDYLLPKMVILLKQGSILADGSKDRILTSEILSTLFDAPVRVFRDDGYFHLH